MTIRGKKRKRTARVPWALAVLALATIGGGPMVAGAWSSPEDNKPVAELEILSDADLILELAQACAGITASLMNEDFAGVRSGIGYLHSPLKPVAQKRFRLTDDQALHLVAQFKGAAFDGAKWWAENGAKWWAENRAVKGLGADLIADHFAKAYEGCRREQESARKTLSSRPWWKFW